MSPRLDQFLYRKEKSRWERILLSPLLFLSFFYAGAIRARNGLYSLGLFKTRRLPLPVISVGNITVGGTGKTPLVITLARSLLERGLSPVILSRGYGGKNPSGPLVTDGRTVFLSPEESGDEPFLMAHVLKGVPLLIGKDRFKIGGIALRRFPVRAFLLDDGFQHLALHRDLDILLIDANVGFGDRRLLPRGMLREPLTHLRRADLFLLTKVKDLETCRVLEEELRELFPSSPVFHCHYESRGVVTLGGAFEPLQLFKGQKVLALSGIGNPAYFSSLLKQCGMEVTGEMIFPDHHPYTTRDIQAISKQIKGADCVVTTEKDMVKLKGLVGNSFPLLALRIELEIEEEEAFYERVLKLF